MEPKALILDLDNTLYSWMEAYVPSFLAQINYLEENTLVDKEVIKKDFKSVYKKYGSVEIPTAVFELGMWKTINLPPKTINRIQLEAMNLFFEEFSNNICLFPNVKETLKWAKENSFFIFGISDAFSYWIDFRIKCVDIGDLFETIYAVDDTKILNSNVISHLSPIETIISLPPDQIKPNTYVVDCLIKKYNFNKQNIYMVGDSIEKDIAMAKNAGIHDVWAKYGTLYHKGCGSLLRSITPWSKSKQQIENLSIKNIIPSFTIMDFGELKEIVM